MGVQLTTSSISFGPMMIKRIDIQVDVHNVFGITSIRYAQNQKIGKPNNLKVFGSIKTKEPKQDSHNRPLSPMPAGEEL
jgi:hypothetical protein